jgi:hypothetical protein
MRRSCGWYCARRHSSPPLGHLSPTNTPFRVVEKHNNHIKLLKKSHPNPVHHLGVTSKRIFQCENVLRQLRKYLVVAKVDKVLEFLEIRGDIYQIDQIISKYKLNVKNYIFFHHIM